MSLHLTRRTMLRHGALYLATAGASSFHAAAEEPVAPLLRVGMLTDLHYADKPPASNRYYRETLTKLDTSIATFNDRPPSFVIELGDFIDRASTVEQELEWLATIETRFAQLKAPRHYVFGNHCVDTLTKDEFARHTGMKHPPHHAFEHGGIHFIILDACFREDGVAYGRKNFHWQNSFIPSSQLEWLKTTLSKITTGQTIIFAHQRLDNDPAHSVRNAPAVREILEQSGCVSAVFQGHSHKNDHQHINGIHYTTLVAMVEGSGTDHGGHAMLEIMPDASLKVLGFKQQTRRDFASKTSPA